MAGELNSVPLPPVQTDNAQLSSAGKFFVKKIRLDGNTVFSEKDFEEILSPYQNRNITSEELQEIRNTITQFYISKGYVNSGCYHTEYH